MTRNYPTEGAQHVATPSAESRAAKAVPTAGARTLAQLVATFALSVALLVAWVAPASAVLTRPLLSSFGSFSHVQSIATDASGNVYVYDGGAGTVYKFDSDGNPVNFSATGTNSISNVGFSSASEGEIAVDSSGGPANGDIYVAHAEGSINIYSHFGSSLGELTEAGHPWGEACGVAVDNAGNVYVGLYPENVDKYVPTANPVTNTDYVSSLVGLSGVCNVAADSAGDLFADTWRRGPITRYEPSQFGSLSAIGSVVDTNGSSLAISPNDNDLFVDEQNQISGFGPKGELFEEPVVVFADSGEISGSEGVAVNATNNDLYASDGKGAVDVFGPAVLLPTVSTGPASNVAAETATVSGEVDPEGIQVEQCYFEYGETAAYGHTTPCAEGPSEIGANSKNIQVHADLVGLSANITYHYRLATRSADGISHGGDKEFAFLSPVVAEEYASNVAGTSATLNASVDPEGRKAEYYFEYGPTANYGATTPKLEVQGGTSFSFAQAHLQELSDETTYHYRLVAISSAGTTEGSDLTFTTQGAGGSVALLDGRQWELVSPPVKYGAGVLHQLYEGSLIQASTGGDAVTYIASNPIEAEPEGSRPPEAIQILAKRSSAGGWSNRTIVTRNEEIQGLSVGAGNEYKAFSPDLTSSIIEPVSGTPLVPSATERTSYLRNETGCADKATDCFTPLLTPEDTLLGAKWDPNPESIATEAPFVGASADLTHTVIQASVPLTEGAAEKDLYEWSDGQLKLVSVNETGEAVPGELGGAGQTNVRNAISSDGSRVIWCEEGFGGCGAFGRSLYMRDTQRNETIHFGGAGGREPEFQVANEDDSRIFFTITPEGTYERQLDECEITEQVGKLVCNTTEVSPEEVGLVLGINKDGTTVYYVSTVAVNAGAPAGGDNLYVAHFEGDKWDAHFIASLSSEDGKDWAQNTGLNGLTARVSPNGRFLAFMSDNSLTGYDNHDAVSGELDEEVFLYSDQTNKLVCASCDRSGARPRGLLYVAGPDAPLPNSAAIWRNRWVAASVPGWDNIDLSRAFHQPTYLTDEGRLFFNSSDTLTPEDTNGLDDVYEYEPQDAGSCIQADGCVGLISSGASGEESMFFDASASGDDVFFATSARLVPLDVDTAVDVYDAHVCTTAVPCLSPQVLPRACSSGESCKQAPTPQPSIFGEPASATFSGTGNVVQVPSTTHKAAKPVKRHAHKVSRKRPKRKTHKAHGSRRRAGRGQASRALRSLKKGRGR